MLKLRPYAPTDLSQVLQFTGQCYRDRNFSNYHPGDHELVVVAPDGRFAAFLIYWLDPISKSGLFEPVGCHEEFQRRGFAKALMYEAMRRMLNAGMEVAIVGYDSDNLAARNLYTAVGFLEHVKTLDCEIHLGKEEE